jgi:hypothetical protein
MTFTVVWLPEAEAGLAEIWTAADDKDAVSDAANYIDELLRINPASHGLKYIDSTRCLLIAPLGILFDVNDADRRVRILTVWYIPSYTTNGEARNVAGDQ